MSGPGRDFTIRSRVRVIGAGRAGGSFSLALAQAGWRVGPLVRRGDALARAANGVDLVLIATPDAVVSEIAAGIEPDPEVVIAHCAGSLPLTVLGQHRRVASIHPLMSLPSPEVGAARLAGAWFAVAGDPMAQRVVDDLGGRCFEVPDDRRALYHAAACIASNHIVALLGQVERVAAVAQVPLAAFFELARASVDNAEGLGPAAALTGPVARGDWATVERHRQALRFEERAGYDALVALASRLAERES
jgi:predicted short-subunit dehydrogenase-like oxidoreductase (DUF2520 family)